MKCQRLFYKGSGFGGNAGWGNMKRFVKCRLLIFLPRIPSVKQSVAEYVDKQVDLYLRCLHIS